MSVVGVELAPDLGDHRVPRDEADARMGGVDGVLAGQGLQLLRAHGQVSFVRGGFNGAYPPPDSPCRRLRVVRFLATGGTQPMTGSLRQGSETIQSRTRGGTCSASVA